MLSLPISCVYLLSPDTETDLPSLSPTPTHRRLLQEAHIPDQRCPTWGCVVRQPVGARSLAARLVFELHPGVSPNSPTETCACWVESISLNLLMFSDNSGGLILHTLVSHPLNGMLQILIAHMNLSLLGLNATRSLCVIIISYKQSLPS